MTSRTTDQQKIDRALALRNSAPLDLGVVFTSADADYVSSLLYHEMEAYGLIPPQAKYAKRLSDHLRLIVYNLRLVHAKDPARYLSYSRHSNQYVKKKGKGAANAPSHRYVVRVIDFLIDHDYVENVPGFRNPANPSRSRQSRMRAKVDLVQLFLTQWDDGDSQGVLVQDTGESVVVKGVKIDRKRRVCKTPNTPAVRLMRANLKLINSAMDQAKITLDLTPAELKALNARLSADPDPYRHPVDFERKRLYRVFMDRRLDRGGRFYGPWYQNVYKEYRARILIEGAPVLEPDFSGYHIGILYALKGLDMPAGDPYQMDGYSDEVRPFLKTLLLIMVNAESRKSVRGALLEANMKGKLILPPEIKSFSDNDLDPIINKFLQKHHAIAEYFNTGYGVTLQYIDSQIAEAIMVYFAEMGHPCLPVHDSFMVDMRLFESLIKAMEEAFLSAFGRMCPVKQDMDPLFYRMIEVLEAKLVKGEIKEDELRPLMEELRRNNPSI